MEREQEEEATSVEEMMGTNSEVTQWIPNRQAKRVPLFVQEQTGLSVKADVVNAYGDDAVFTKGGLPPPRKTRIAVANGEGEPTPQAVAAPRKRAPPKAKAVAAPQAVASHHVCPVCGRCPGCGHVHGASHGTDARA